MGYSLALNGKRDRAQKYYEHFIRSREGRRGFEISEIYYTDAS